MGEQTTNIGGLTPREITVATMVCRGARSRDIAQVLGLSQRTVECHRLNFMRKLRSHGVTNVQGLIEFFGRNVLSCPEEGAQGSERAAP